MCCTHSYDWQVCPIILGWSSETRVRQRSERGQREVGDKRYEVEDDRIGDMKLTQLNTIIRLGCIKEDTGFKYRRFGNKGLEQKEILEHNGRSD